MHLALLLAALQGAIVTVQLRSAADTVPLFRPDSAAIATAYPDAGTRELVRLARAHRGAIDDAVFRYQATIRQRLSVGIRALRRDRLLYRRETAAAVDWRRDGESLVEVLGAREAVPVVMPGLQVPSGLEAWGRLLVPRPGDDRLFVAPTEGGFAWHPLIEGGEAVYRYATGDTTVIRLPDDRSVRLVELRVTPRERDIRLVTGSLWIELENHAIVRALIRPSREFDLERDLPRISPEDAGDVDEVPSLFKPIRFDLRYITIEFGLWEMRWWMPRLVAVDGYLQMGAIQFPMTFETVYSDYVVEPDRHGLPSLPPVIRQLAGDPLVRPRPYGHRTRVVIPDSAGLLTSPLLPADLYAAGESLITEQEMRELSRRLGALPPPPWEVGRPRVSWPWRPGSGLLRYNRVEGASAGARVDWDLTRFQLDLTGRFGLADREPGAELGLELPKWRRAVRMAGYRRLAAVDPSVRAFGIGNSLSALAWGRDHGMYYRATGAELRVTPAPGERRYELRMYGERQAAVDGSTDFSLRHVLDRSYAFRSNIVAAAADQLGVSAVLGHHRGLDPRRPRWGTWLDVTAETGTYTFLRPALLLQLDGPLPGPFVGSVELAGGTTQPRRAGGAEAPIQAWWSLGGAATLRGFDGGTAMGPDFARTRLEIANEFPGARLALFSDAGWAGRREDFSGETALVSAGIGASLLDGLLRVDLARALQPTTAWRVEAYLDMAF